MIFDKDGIETKAPEKLDSFFNLFRRVPIKKEYKLSRWAQEVVSLLQEKGKMKNVDIIDELRKRGYNNNAAHINKFFKSNNGKNFYKEKLIGKSGYWSLKDWERKSNTVSVPIMITNKMKIELGLLGYTKDDIRNLTPIKANKILSKNIITSQSRERGKNQ